MPNEHANSSNTTPDAAHPATRASGFGVVLKAQRLARGLTLEALADRAGCTKGYLSLVERGSKPPPAEALIERLEEALSLEAGSLSRVAQWEQTPSTVKRDLARLESSRRAIDQILRTIEKRGLDEAYASGELARAVGRLMPASDNGPAPDAGASNSDNPSNTAAGSRPPAGLGRVLPTEVPLINSVTAGYPADFTDLGYPARVADEYVRSPDLADPDAFAARVVGDSMEPEYREGDLVIFSPAMEVVSGNDCFVRLEPDHESTFKRVYFETDEGGGERIRIQPINNRYPPKTVPREDVAGLYRAAQIMRAIG
ncbi:MAG: repressor LexA [Phycisphaerales bacterium]|jgi:repressor LexA